jgi:hypothetical protein
MKFRRAFAVTAVVMGAALMASISSGQTYPDPQAAPVVVDIAQMPAGAAPLGFDFGRTGRGTVGLWRVVEEKTAAGGKAIASDGQDKTDYRFPLAMYRPVSARDVDVTVHFKPVAGTVDQAGGIAVRVISPDDYYVVRANALENNVRFYRVTHGSRRQLEGFDTKVASGQWHTLGLRAEGNRFIVSFDGRELFFTEDDTYSDVGQVALWTKADSLTLFDRIEIRTLR